MNSLNKIDEAVNADKTVGSTLKGFQTTESRVSGYPIIVISAIVLIILFGIVYSVYFKSNGSKTEVVLKDRQGNVAVIKESYDCWEIENKADECRTIVDAQKSKGDHLTGFRSHHVIYMGKEYAFVENWRRGAPSYVSGAFNWNKDDVLKFIKVPIEFAGGSDKEMKFSFSSTLEPPFQSLSKPPTALEGKDFVLNSSGKMSSIKEAQPTTEASTVVTCLNTIECYKATLVAMSKNDIETVRLLAEKIDSFGKPVRGNRPLARKLNEEGLKLFRNESYTQAASIFTKAQREDPSDVEIAANVGYAKVKGGDYSGANDALMIALQLNPRRINTWVPIAELIARQNQSPSDAVSALLVAYEFSTSKEKAIDYFTKQENVQQQPQLKVAFGEAIRKINVAANDAEVNKIPQTLTENNAKASPANQGAMPDKTNLLKFIFEKKWSFGGIPCNSAGGSYMEYTNKNKLGLINTFKGIASKDTPQEMSYTYEVTGDRTFIFSLNVYVRGNSLLETLMPDPNARVTAIIRKVELISPKKLTYTSNINQLDLMKLLETTKANRPEILFEVRHEEGFSNLCEGL